MSIIESTLSCVSAEKQIAGCVHQRNMYLGYCKEG